MDGDEFTHRYQLLKKLVDGEVVTYLARASSGDRVMTHFLQGSRPDELLAALDDLPEARRRRVRTVTNLDGTPVVVTDYLDGFDSFAAWTSGPGPAAPEASPATGGPSAAASAEDVPPESGSTPEPPDAGPDGPGEFTRLFEAPDAAPEAGAAAGPEPAGPAPDSGSVSSTGDHGTGPGSADEDEQPGEFTRMFEAPGAVPEGDAPSEEASATGEAEGRNADDEARSPGSVSGDPPFLFRSPVQEASAGEEEATPDPSGSEAAGRAGARSRGGDEASAEPPAPDRDREAREGAEGAPGEFTRMFEAPSAGGPGRDDRQGSEEADAPSPEEPEPDEPGEFTRQFGSEDALSDEGRPPERDETSAGSDPTPEAPSGGPAGAAPEAGERRDEGSGGGSATDAFRAPDPSPTPDPSPGGSREASGPSSGGGGEGGPGEFTRMFGSRGGPETSESGLVPPESGSGGSGGAQAEDPDDYLRRLGAEPPSPSPGPGRGTDPDAGTTAGGASEPGGASGAGSGGPGVGGSGDAPSPRGPSDYTRVVRGRAAKGEAGSPRPAPAPPSPAEEETRHWPYLVALGSILVVAVVLLVVFLVTGGADDGAPAGDSGGGEAATEEVVSPPAEGG